MAANDACVGSQQTQILLAGAEQDSCLLPEPDEDGGGLVCGRTVGSGKYKTWEENRL